MLHILNGDAVREVFEQAGIEGDCCVFADVLHEGPLSADPTDIAFTEARIRHAVEAAWVPPDVAASFNAEWTRGLAAATSHDEVVLWFEHDLFDQLLLIHHLEWLRRSGVFAHDSRAAGPRVSLICIGEFPGIERFSGLGQLTPAQLASLLPGRTPIGSAQLDAARLAWSAVTGDDPRAIERVIAADTSALPFLAGALQRLLEEYPHVGSGLSRTELQALRAVDAGNATIKGAFRAQADMEERVFLGDVLFLALLRRLASAREPLVLLEATEPETDALPDSTIEITSFGRRVLAGEADHVTHNGIDRWIGGVHLAGTSVPWRWDPERRALVE